MESSLALVIGFLLISGGVLAVIGIIAFARSTFKPTPSSPRTSQDGLLDGMDEGDYHNGPGGYTASSSYSDSFYGGHHDEGDTED